MKIESFPLCFKLLNSKTTIQCEREKLKAKFIHKCSCKDSKQTLCKQSTRARKDDSA